MRPSGKWVRANIIFCIRRTSNGFGALTHCAHNDIVTHSLTHFHSFIHSLTHSLTHSFPQYTASTIALRWQVSLHWCL
jgi:hypothetical protein